MPPGRASPSAQPWASPDWSASSPGNLAHSKPTCARTHRSAMPGSGGSTPSGGERRPVAHDAAGRPRGARDHRGARIAMRIVGLIGILALAAPALAVSQGRPTLAFRGDAGFVWVRSDTAPAGAGAIRLRGPVLGGEGRLVFNGFSVGLGLSSGTLKAADQGTAKRDLIEGRLLLAARPFPWLEMSVGPFVRAYVTDAVTERWVFWQAGPAPTRRS